VLADPDFAAQLLSLRLAVLFHHARRAIDTPRITLAMDRPIRFGVAARWLKAHPLTAHLLEKERLEWAALKRPWRTAR
jgi:exopolyphosphatase/guanosine-5'-triphosphate,3'-diphosphate pyrophosphatase